MHGLKMPAGFVLLVELVVVVVLSERGRLEEVRIESTQVRMVQFAFSRSHFFLCR